MASTATSSLRWLSLVAVIWLQSINGTNTNFPAYSSELKRLLSLSQLQLNNLAFASDAGKLFGLLSGIASLYLPLWLVLFIGSTLGLIGYGLQYLFLIHQISSLSYWQVFSLTVLAGNSICWINTVCYIVAVRHFPLQLQVAVGLSTSYVGLSAMIYTALVDAVVLQYRILERAAPAYLLLNATLPLMVSVITAPLVGGGGGPSIAINNYMGSGRKVRSGLGAGFLVISMITASTGVYAIISSLGSNYSGKVKVQSPNLINVIAIGMCLALPLVVPVGEYLRKLWAATETTNGRVCDVSLNSSSSSSSYDCDDDHEEEDVESRRPVKGAHFTTTDGSINMGAPDHHDDKVAAVMEEIGAKLMLKRLDFWLYFLVYLLGATVGLVYLNNLGQIAESRGWSTASSLVSLSSAFGFLGRLLPCLLHYICSRRERMVPGPASIAAAMVPLSGAFFLLLDGSRLSLCISTAIVGVCTGTITTVCVSVTSQLFGRKNFGVNHNVVVANIPMGSFLFGDLAAYLYRRGQDHDAAGRCLGLSCYHKTFIVWGCICSFATFLALLLHFRTRKFYSSRTP